MISSEKDVQLAQIFINHSLKIKPKEKVLIEVSDFQAWPLVKATYIETLKKGAYPMIDFDIHFQGHRASHDGLLYEFYKYANDWQLKHIPKEVFQGKIDWADAYISIVTLENTNDLTQIPLEKIAPRRKLFSPYRDHIVNTDRWLLTYYPTQAMAQEAGVSLDWFLDFYYKVCIVDYKKMERDLKKIEKVLDLGKHVQILGKNTDLKFSIHKRLAQACFGERNIPDGEVFLAPVWETVEGTVYFDFPTNYAGAGEVADITLTFKKGRVVEAQAGRGESILHKILDTDPQSRALGELGIGANFNIRQALKDTLFDEKIGGTVHLALGRSYQEKRGGAPEGHNDSAIHWDIVKDMRLPGSVLLVDNKPLLKAGKFVV